MVALCPAPGPLQWAELDRVVDGDTVRLADGRSVRLIAVNTPELGHGKAPDQPLAREATAAARTFLGEKARVGLRIGSDPRDRYGRTLAYLYNTDGESLAAHLIDRGLGWRIVVPPNTAHQACLAQREQQARRAGLGVWSEPDYRVRDSSALGPGDAGFGLVSGRVVEVTATDAGWWIDLPGLVLRLSRQDRKYFTGDVPDAWLHRRVTVRGWIVDRSASKAVKQRGYAPFLLVLRHPGMINVDAAAPADP